MPRLTRLRGPAPVGIALALWDVWRKLPPQQRQQVLALARKHGPTVASRIAKTRKRRP
jgi:hypothetical protein